MNAGRLRHRVVVESVTRTMDAMSQPVETWSIYATLWANIQPLMGRDFIAAQAANSEVTAKIETRYKSGIAPTMRIRHDTVIYKILGIENESAANRRLYFFVREQPQGST